MQFSFLEREGSTWRFKTSIRRYYAGLLSAGGGGMFTLLAIGISTKSSGIFFIAGFALLTILGIYWLGSGPVVTVDLEGRRFGFEGGGEVGFDEVHGLWVDTALYADAEAANRWFRLHVLFGPEGRKLLERILAGNLSGDADRHAPEGGVRLVGATWRNDALKDAAEDLARRLDVPAVGVLWQEEESA